MSSNAECKTQEANEKGILQKISRIITGTLENIFYRLGRTVGGSPWITILVSLLLCGACMAGFLRFEQESRGEKLWVPQDSKAQDDKEWVEKMFPEESGQVNFILEKSNVLKAEVIQQVFKIHQEVMNITITFENKSLEWKDICFRKGDICSLASILELWSFDENTINSLNDDKVLEDINNRGPLSPYSKSAFNIARLLADISYKNGSIRGAKFLKASYFYERLPSLIDPTDNVDPRGGKWEEAFGKIVEKYSDLLYMTRTKFREISSDAIAGDVILLTTGYFIILLYVIIILGKFTRLEIKAWVALGGIISVGLSVGVSMGLCSAFGFFYGPAHTTLPFLLLGIGVDDLFVIVQSWSNMPDNIHKSESVQERIGLALKHAGPSITITTLTDLLAFLVGVTTIIPGLRSFCFYAAVGILCDYILQTTFFVAWLSIDARRADKHRDGCCCCCILPQDYKPNECGEKSYLQIFYEKVIGSGVVKLPVKIFIFLIVIALLGVNIYGTTELKQQFEPKWFLPPGTIVRDYMDLNDEKFVQGGSPIAFYTGSINYFKEQKYLSENTIDSWYEKYIEWANKSVPDSVYNTSRTIKTESQFYTELKSFLNSSNGKRFTNDIVWNKQKTEIVATRIRAFLKILTETQDHVKAMDKLRNIIENIGFSSDPIVYNRLILFAEGHKVISQELFRNILLAMAVVFLVTLVIIASPVMSVLVFLCVVFTVVDVTGLMYFWGLTIDTVSTVVIIIAIGLSVDYASHVGHTFLVKSGNRKERTIKMYRDIGPAVWNGGFSTFLAIVPLATSQSHVFTTFFRILFGVVVFGVFHGLFFLPAILSMIGPAPYESAKKMESTSKEADFGRKERNDIENVASHSNEAIETGTEVYPVKNGGPFILNNMQQTNNETLAAANAGVDAEGAKDTKPNGRISVVEMHL
ncbi:patched domain-containing protein 3-like [Dendronephthya gigantea]|uniref:patched domain-containing protein 3-like n=1 Tax=Dendronephthya gigantea TaxID=151771 RepID=UPI00106BFA8B|nr:patched domain-containing protein 3-like [Dendronephthya gigantea]